jgi:hypothetical protein
MRFAICNKTRRPSFKVQRKVNVEKMCKARARTQSRLNIQEHSRIFVAYPRLQGYHGLPHFYLLQRVPMFTQPYQNKGFLYIASIL